MATGLVSLIEASTPGTGPRFHILSPSIFQNHSPLHLMSVTNSPWIFFLEKPCATEFARCIFRLDRGNLPNTLGFQPYGWPWCWAWRGGPRKCRSFIYQWTLEFEFQSPWYRLHWGWGRIDFFGGKTKSVDFYKDMYRFSGMPMLPKICKQWVEWYIHFFMKGTLFIFIISCYSVLAGPNLYRTS